jgi:hypothetical protein
VKRARAPATAATNRREKTMDPHHHREESNLKDGLMGIAIGVTGLVIVMAIAHYLALALH